jgi:predicted nucleotide-binding protein (sugar kinase/HSP70/actin superfamily)
LLTEGVDHVFVPAVVHLQGQEPDHSYACPYTMAVPFIVDIHGHGRCLSPVVSFANEEAFAAGFEDDRECLGASRDRVREAFRAGVEVQAALVEEFRERAGRLMKAGEQRRIFGILGRPYNAFDSFVNLGLFERLRRLDVLAVPMDFLPLDPPSAPTRTGLPWHYPGDMLLAAAALAGTQGIHPVILSSYGCGPDAFALRQMGEILTGKPHLVLEFDAHRGEAGLVTRVEAFLDQLQGDSHASLRRRNGHAVSAAFFPPTPATIWVPYFADHAYAYSGLLRYLGHTTRVLPPPGPEIRTLGEKYALGKECHAYSMILGDLLQRAAQRDCPESVFFFPGTSIPCLLHEYGRSMQSLLEELGIDGLRVSSPNGKELVEIAGLKAIERFYTGLLAIELLVKAVCQIRPYECERGATDRLHRENLERIETAIAEGEVLEALDEALQALSRLPLAGARDRPIVGLVGDLYTRVNPVANQELIRWLEEQGLEVWPSPFQIDLLDFGISRNLYQSLTSLDLPSLLTHGSVALLRAVHLWRVRNVVGSRVARHEEPGYLEMKRLAAPYMPNEAHALLYLHVAKTVDFARSGVNGIANAICFGCMVGNAAAAVNERIRKDYGNVPILTAVYSGGDDPSRRMALEAFVSQVKAHYQRQAPGDRAHATHPEDGIASLARRGLERITRRTSSPS